MEYIVEKIGMSRTITVPSVPVTLLKVIEAKVCEVDAEKRAIVAYASGKKMNRSIAGKQKKYNLSAQFNRFVTLEVANEEAGDLDTSSLNDVKVVKSTFDIMPTNRFILTKTNLSITKYTNAIKIRSKAIVK